MRYVFQVGILVEEQSIKFYTKLAEKSSDVDVKKLCSRLAIDEADHKKLFQDMLSRWLSVPADKQTLDSLIQELKKAGFLSDAPLADASEKDVIEYAIEQEKKTADFYLSFEKTFPGVWKKMHIHQLVITERTHASNLKSLLSRMK